MSDLISRSALINKLKEKSIVDEVNIISTTYTYKELVYIICNLPTAYDVEKVVAELEEERDYAITQFANFLHEKAKENNGLRLSSETRSWTHPCIFDYLKEFKEKQIFEEET